MITDERAERPAALPSLTGLRFVAALLVVYSHFGAYRRAPGPQGALDVLAEGGWMGVTLFFILSGFILAYGYLDAAGRLRCPARAFWVARVARLYPLYLVALASAALPYAWGHDPRATPLPTLLVAPVLLQSWLPFVALGWNPPGWSLSAEALFYALFPLLAPAVGRLGRRALLALVLAMVAAAALVPLAYALMSPDHLRSLVATDATWLEVAHFNPLLRLPEFVLGLALGRLYVDARASSPDADADADAGCGISARRPRRPGLYSAAALLMAALAPLLGAALRLPLLPAALVVPAFALLIYSLAWQRGALARPLASRPLVALGGASYALYLLHYPLHAYLTRLLGLLGVPEQGASASLPVFCAFLGLAVAASRLAQRYVETPARRALLRAGARPGTARLGPRAKEVSLSRPAPTTAARWPR